MINTLLNEDTKITTHKEGDLFKNLRIHGQDFKIYYGYYEEYERYSPDALPMPIYPDFKENPQYTKDGFPFVTKMQDACKYYKGKIQRFSDCAECEYYKHGADLIGICICSQNIKKEVIKNDKNN